MNRINSEDISIPSSLRVFPTNNSWFPADITVPGEVDHLRTNQCPTCGGWQTREEVMVYRPGGEAFKRTVQRCHGHRERYGPRCAPQIIGEEPMDNYNP